MTEFCTALYKKYIIIFKTAQAGFCMKKSLY